MILTEEVMVKLVQLDGTIAGATAMLNDLTREELEELGGFES